MCNHNVLVPGALTQISLSQIALDKSATYARLDLPAVVDAEGNVISEAVSGYLTHINDKPVAP